MFRVSGYPAQPPFLVVRKEVSLPDSIILHETLVKAEKVHNGLIRSGRRFGVYRVSTDVRIFNNEIRTDRHKFGVNIKFCFHMCFAVVRVKNHKTARRWHKLPYLLDDSRISGTSLDHSDTGMREGFCATGQFYVNANYKSALVCPDGVKKGRKVEKRAALSDACLKDKGRFQAINKFLIELQVQGALQDRVPKKCVPCPRILRVIPEHVKGVDYQLLYERASQEPPQFFVQRFVHRADFTPCLKKSKEIGGVLYPGLDGSPGSWGLTYSS